VRRNRTAAVVALLLSVSACNHSTPYSTEPRSVPGVAPEAIALRLILIGDTGRSETSSAAPLPALSAHAGEIADRTTVAFLGDLIYEYGLPPASALGRKEAEQRIDVQIEAVRRSAAGGIFVPGNHDWDSSRTEGWAHVLELQKYLDAAAAAGARVTQQPRGGCPGPAAVPLTANVDLIILDTQWWLHGYAKPAIEQNQTGCTHVDRAGVRAALQAALLAAHAAGHRAVVLAHHPLKSSGVHAGFSDWKMHVFPFTAWNPDAYIPLPFLGSISPVLRALRSPLVQDMTNPIYKSMIASVGGALDYAAKAGAAPLLYAAGHDHHLEVMKSDDARYHLISGYGSATYGTVVTHGENTLFAHSGPQQPGFMQLDFLADGRVRLAVIEALAAAQQGTEVYSRWLE
jgi:hypothetical protein